MARNMYGATSADFTLTAGGRVVAANALVRDAEQAAHDNADNL